MARSRIAIERLGAGRDGAVIRSPGIRDGGDIPMRYSAYGDNISPPLQWSGLPPGTKSVAILEEDPDAPGNRPYVHWIVANIPPDVSGFEEGTLPEGAIEGRNSSGSIGYFGSMPPKGDPPHHYHFQLFALDRMLDVKRGVGRDAFMDAIEGHVLAAGALVGTFQARA